MGMRMRIELQIKVDYTFRRRIFCGFMILFCVYLTAPLFAQKSYWSGEVRTKEAYLYGRFEVRMKSAEAGGVTSTFFTYNTSSSAYNEIDIEIMGRYNNELSFNTFIPDQSEKPFRQVVKFNPHDGFHIYAIEWTPDYVAWRVDGYEIYRQNDLRVTKLYIPQNIMMNFWPPVWADWAGVLDANKLPLYAVYDWVKVYSYTPGQNDNFTFLWKDEFNSIDPNRWILSNSTFGSNLADFKSSNVVARDGYLILCMTKPNNGGYSGGNIEDNDFDPPYIVSASGYKEKIKIVFSENVDSYSAETLENYIIPGLEIKKAELKEDKHTVFLYAGGIQPDILYNLFVRDICDMTPQKNKMELTVFKVPSLPVLPIKINAGGSAINGFLTDQIWDSYKFYGGMGGVLRNTTGIKSGNADSVIYKTALEGMTFYNVVVSEGIYDITFMLSEPDYIIKGERVFDIYCNNSLIAENVDISDQAGINKGFEKTISSFNAVNGALNFYFKPKKGKPIINGIRITPSISAVINENKNNIVDFKLFAYPNPFNASVKIDYQIENEGLIKLSLVDLLGRELEVLKEGYAERGSHSIYFTPGKLSSGVYFLRLLSREKTMIRKIIQLK